MTIAGLPRLTDKTDTEMGGVRGERFGGSGERYGRITEEQKSTTGIHASLTPDFSDTGESNDSIYIYNARRSHS